MPVKSYSTRKKEYLNKREHWDILNKYVYNIENKIIGLATMLSFQIKDLTYECRKINSKNKLHYDYRICCSLKFQNRLIIRIYYEPETNKTIYKIFPKIGDLQNTKMFELHSEEELDNIITMCMTYISKGDWAYERFL